MRADLAYVVYFAPLINFLAAKQIAIQVVDKFTKESL